MTNGRGAWSTRGKDNGVVYYQVVPGMPFDGSTPEKGPDYVAVNLGVQAIQRRVNQFLAAFPLEATPPPLDPDGVFGPKTSDAVGWATAHFAMPASTPPRVGATLARSLWHNLPTTPAHQYHVPAASIGGIMLHESSADPGAVGYFNPDDHGLVQINAPTHPAVTLEQAFDPIFAFDFAGKYLAGYQALFGGKGPELQTQCTIASWNSPAKAKTWYRDGTPPDSQIYNYTVTVAALAGEW